MQFEEISLASCATHVVDNRGKTCPVGDVGRPLIATNCVRQELLYPTLDTKRFVSEETYKTWFRGHPIPGDIIFVTKGSPGRVCLAPDPVDFCIAQDMVAIRADDRKVYAKYLFAALRSVEVQRRIENMHVGTLIPHFKKGDFDKLYLPVPARHIQTYIGDLYFDLSARVDLLQRANATLEAIAQALFKSWFIDFDPVRAKAEGREPEGRDAATAALFPAEFEDSPLGAIPKGWRLSRVGDTFLVTMGQSPPGETYNEDGVGVPFYQGRADFGFRFPSVRVHCTAATRFASARDVLVSVRAPVGDVNVAFEQCAIGRGVAAVRFERSSSFALYAMKALRDRFSEYESHGTVFGSINKKQFEALPCIAPDPETLRRFTDAVAPIDERIMLNEMQGRVLSELRDTLLPRLISGKLRLPEARAQVEEALA